jgi:hypothetical protein
MLAYVFWHRRKEEEVSREAYEERINRFHTAIRESHLNGFLGSVVARLSKAPWFNPPNSEGYEDWYILEGSEVLDRLNEIAVTDDRKYPHDDIAKYATDFRAGLYQLKSGTAESVSEPCAMWISKPRGTPYDSFYNDMDRHIPKERASLWRRQMTLGPTTEFCIMANSNLAIPQIYNPVAIERKIVTHLLTV